MSESIGLIERAAALLRQRDADESDPVPLPAGEIDAGHGGPELVLDRGRLASYGITMPSSARSRTVEEFRLVKRNLMTQFSQGDSGPDQRSNRLIMVTSARPGEGKTFISLNLAWLSPRRGMLKRYSSISIHNIRPCRLSSGSRASRESSTCSQEPANCPKCLSRRISLI